MLFYISISILISLLIAGIANFAPDLSLLDKFDAKRLGLGIVISLFLSLRGLKRKSLSFDGAIAAFFIGLLLFTINPPFGFILIIFYLAGSAASKYKAAIKGTLEENVKHCREAPQVLACSLVLLGSAAAIRLNPLNLKEACIIGLASMACNLGDTLASEIGSAFSATPPILITTFKRVPPGTNGGISPMGTLCSFLGGILMGLSYYLLMQLYPHDIAPFSFAQSVFIYGGLGGLFGSFIDSIMGATCQATWWNKDSKKISSSRKGQLISGYAIFSNEAVNLISSLLTGLFFLLVV